MLGTAGLLRKVDDGVEVQPLKVKVDTEVLHSFVAVEVPCYNYQGEVS